MPPGRALAAAMKAAMSCAGKSVFTATTCGKVQTWLMGRKAVA
jgi:hypothetical protein